MRVLFIYPNLDAEESFNHGIAALSGALKARGHTTGLIHLNEVFSPVPSPQEIVERVRQWGPGLLAFSVMTQQYSYALSLARVIKASLPRLPLAVGGIHTIMCTEHVKADGIWDFVGIGECDQALPELVDRLEHGDPEHINVRDFCVRRPDGSYQDNPLGPYPDLSASPPKDYAIFDLPSLLLARNGWQSIMTSRGCPFRCTYCFNHEVVDRYRKQGGQSPKGYLRHHPIPRVISELKDLKRRYGDQIQTFIFDDDILTLDERYCCDLVKAYTGAEIGIPFVLNAHVQAFREPVARALSESPCRIVKFGVESGSYELRKNVLARSMTNQEIIDAFDLCHEYGLQSSAFLMFGLPYETREMMEETIGLIARLTPGRMRWSIFFPFPGTRSHRICQDGGLIDESKMQAMKNFSSASCLKFSADTALFVRKLQRTFHWWVNASAGFPLSGEYNKVTAEIDSLDLDAWEEASETIRARDREISTAYLARINTADPAPLNDYRHYSLRYTEVMAVLSDFVTEEPGDFKNRPVRQWKAFRE
ncbi:MAG: radical SAM protein [Acidobacteria bacterium]|nr:MAG: radical SAM protein [Acidobacteriota bacterium]